MICHPIKVLRLKFQSTSLLPKKKLSFKIFLPAKYSHLFEKMSIMADLILSLS